MQSIQIKKDGKGAKVLFVVESKLILDGAADTYAREMELEKVARVYGADADPIEDDVDMIAITRSGYYSKMDRIHELMTVDPNQPWFIVMDEAHHLGKNDGQFSEILDDLNDHMDHRHLGLTLSATFWHKDSELIRAVLDGRVYGPLLKPDELEQLRAGENLPEISRVQTLRAIQQGYLTALDSLSIVTEINGNSASRYFDPSVGYSKPAGTHISQIIQRKRVQNISDRGAIFFRTTDQADEYAKSLSKKAVWVKKFGHSTAN